MRDHARQQRRRDFLTTAAAGTVAAVVLPTRLQAAELTGTERANVKLVDDFCAAWAAPMDITRLLPYLADDCVYRPTETAPAQTGTDAIVESLGQFVGEATFCEFEVVETFAKGSIVVNERWDRFELPTRKVEWHGVGVFYIVDGKIAEWSDFTIV